jgi:hypothetical protein
MPQFMIELSYFFLEHAGELRIISLIEGNCVFNVTKRGEPTAHLGENHLT